MLNFLEVEGTDILHPSSTPATAGSGLTTYHILNILT